MPVREPHGDVYKRQGQKDEEVPLLRASDPSLCWLERWVVPEPGNGPQVMTGGDLFAIHLMVRGLTVVFENLS